MGTHLHPHQWREVFKRYKELRRDHRKRTCYEMLAEEYGIGWATVNTHIVQMSRMDISTPDAPEPRMEVLTSSDFEIVQIESPPKSNTVLVPAAERMLEMVASDIHFPYEDRAAYAVFLKVAEALQPQVLVLLGDVVDCYAVSAHDKDANRATPAAFRDELLYAKTKLGELREKLPNARVFYKQGNHETRITRYVTKNASALGNLKAVTLPELLNLEDLKIEWIANDARLRIGKLWHIHGNEVSGAGMSPARLKYQRMQCNVIFGHHHVRDKYRPRSYDGQQHGAYANPCLADLEPEYMHHTHAWSHGFTLIDHDVDGTFQVEETEIIKPFPRASTAKCNVRGVIYEV